LRLLPTVKPPVLPERYDFKAKEQEELWNPAHYLAFILHAGNGESVKMIDLGKADTIDRAIETLKRKITRTKKSEEILKASKQLYHLMFAPLQDKLGNVKELFISPESNLNLIPFEILMRSDDHFLIEDYTFNYLAAGRDVLGFGQIHEEGGPPLLIGDPDFDLNIKQIAPETQEANDRRSADLRGFHFRRLPWTKAEVETIHSLLGEKQTILYTGKEATEDVLMQGKAPQILHLATHGFFLEDLDLFSLAPGLFSRGTVLSFKSNDSDDVFLTPSTSLPLGRFENPLLRSGIALAGANTALDTEGDSIGIVTAEKILGLKLRGTEMVVLSACDTGLGDVQSGEGVFGLRRAFTQAGAKSLVMSLWSVPDKETQELMVQFYKNILSGRMNRCQALRQAVLNQMQIVKERYGFPHPLYWGAFVFMGEP
jgi:CHAT domain-containing protein